MNTYRSQIHSTCLVDSTEILAPAPSLSFIFLSFEQLMYALTNVILSHSVARFVFSVIEPRFMTKIWAKTTKCSLKTLTILSARERERESAR